jgi:alkaline phosphatase
MDATPASVFSHTRSRGTSKEIVDQMINGPSRKDLKWTPKAVKADVLMGGGGRVFCTGQTSCSSNNNTDYYSEFKKLGYNVVKSKSQLESLTGTDPLLGIFSLRHLDTWIDKALYPENLQLSQSDPDGFARSNSDQPGLETMTKAALNVLSSQTRCPNGFFLMVEAGHIDKAMHVIDYDRGLGELLELDRTVKIVRQFAETNKPSGETAIFLTSDHGQAYDAYGTVDTQLFNTAPENDANIIKQPLATQQFLQIQKRRSIQEYEDAGWPDLVVDDNGMPTKWEGRFRVTGGKVGTMPHREDFQFKKRPERGTNPLYRKAYQKDSFLGTLFNFDNVIVENPNERGIYITGTLPVESGATVHSPTAVDLYCYGPAEIKLNCAKVMDNTELFFIMADAIGL